MKQYNVYTKLDGHIGKFSGGGSGGTGNGTTFIPSVDSNGNLSWTNDGGLQNPTTVNIKGSDGFSPTVTENPNNTADTYKLDITTSNNSYTTPNLKGTSGSDGTNGVTFTPSVDTDGNLSWSNDGGLQNPDTVNIKGPQGNTGGVTAPVNGFFTMYVDNDGNLYVLSETDMSGVFEYDDTTGNLYFVQEVDK